MAGWYSSAILRQFARPLVTLDRVVCDRVATLGLAKRRGRRAGQAVRARATRHVYTLTETETGGIPVITTAVHR